MIWEPSNIHLIFHELQQAPTKYIEIYTQVVKYNHCTSYTHVNKQVKGGHNYYYTRVCNKAATAKYKIMNEKKIIIHQ